MKYLAVFGDFQNKYYSYIVFEIKNIKNVKNYIDNFYTELKYKDYLTDLDLNENWKLIKEKITRFDALYRIKKEDLKDINNFLFMRRYTYLSNVFPLNKELITDNFLKDFPELKIL